MFLCPLENYRAARCDAVRKGYGFRPEVYTGRSIGPFTARSVFSQLNIRQIRVIWMTGEFLHVFKNSAGRTRTYNQPVNSRLLYH